MNFYVITGASRGLGASLTRQALELGHQVLGISRSPLPPQDRLQCLPLDVGDLETFPIRAQTTLQRYDLKKFDSIHLINNAAILEPVGFTDTLEPEKIRQNIDVNLTAPMILSGLFLRWSELFNGWRTIVNISSGVAQKPLASWGSYSAAKAGLRIFTQALSEEVSDWPMTKVLSFGPGIMDTDMQATVREQSAQVFPEVERFKAYKKEGLLLGPDIVAEHLLELLDHPEKIQKFEMTIQQLL